MEMIAMHLPQFHEIPENNEWWGEGFTEWTCLKRKNKYADDYMPLLGEYDLLKKETMEMQNKLAKEYGVSAFCYYHYYFAGKKLLEKPVENLLKWTDINQKFCFCWANHDWKKVVNGVSEMLVEQVYGNKQDWARHFDYLKQFFLDERYIKINNKPLFIILNVEFQERQDIVDYFNSCCKEIGFDGIYYVQSLYYEDKIKHLTKEVDAVVLREHIYSWKSSISIVRRMINKIRRKLQLPQIFSAEAIMRASLKNAQNFPHAQKYFLGAFSMFNNTYRHGGRGYIIKKPRKDFFRNYIKELNRIAEEKKIEYCFFTAWNEWAEGQCLEPDTKNGYMFLEGIRDALNPNFQSNAEETK